MYSYLYDLDNYVIFIVNVIINVILIKKYKYNKK